jgi:hypothetical protein
LIRGIILFYRDPDPMHGLLLFSARRGARRDMTDREQSPAYRRLPPSARRVFAAIERSIGGGDSATVSYVDFQRDHRVGRQSISISLKLLDHLGMIDIEPGPRLINIFRLSDRWRSIDAVEAVRLAALAREVMMHRRFERARSGKSQMGPNRHDPKEPRDGAGPAPSDKRSSHGFCPKATARPHMQRRVPSLPTMPWHDDGR